VKLDLIEAPMSQADGDREIESVSLIAGFGYLYRLKLSV
jgi:hypothetical protein